MREAELRGWLLACATKAAEMVPGSRHPEHIAGQARAYLDVLRWLDAHPAPDGDGSGAMVAGGGPTHETTQEQRDA